MTQHAHTKGPWFTAKEWDAEENEQHIVHIDGQAIAYIGGFSNMIDNATSEANARLIAAAPDLLEALKSNLFTLRRLWGAETNLVVRNEIEAEIVKAQTAIAKATEAA